MLNNHRNLSNAAAVLGVLLSLTLPIGLGGQEAKPQQQSPHDLSTLKAAFSSHSKDFRALEKALSGEELEVVMSLDDIAYTAGDRLFSANIMLGIYDCISSQADRTRARPILKEYLGYLSCQMNSEADRTTGSLAFTRIPAAAQMGLQMKEDLQAAKQKLDAIAASL